MMIRWDFTGKTALVVGGSRGIGAAVVRLIAGAGGRVAWTGRDPAAAGVEAPRDGATVKAIALDVTDEPAVRRAVDGVLVEWGSIDYLVYNAGFSSQVPLLSLSAEQWRQIADINLTGAFIAARAVLPSMAERKNGAIVLVGSAAVYSGGGGRADYAAAKAGLDALARSITRELSPSGIRCNVVHPSLIDTDLLRSRHADPDQRADLARRVPVRRLGSADEVASAIAFLLSDEAAYITAQSLLIDGGRTFCS